ncbi:MAG TPA: malto-oligosyltrehalose trehalohydrolase [Gemmataceae bacterium]|nr:malto-oligosyltrehalose trehalohydrolase [Gemmataceae bacterium]
MSRRRLPIGAEVLAAGGVHFRVWAPRRRRVEVVLEGGPDELPQSGPLAVELQAEGSGYFAGKVAAAVAGSLYRFRLDGAPGLYPDPASRFQPQGPHGPAQVIDPAHFPWTDSGWRGAGLKGQIIYEMHIGTFTREGTWEAAARELPELAALGVTVLEVMPVAEFPGRFGWGYDGVDLFAPTRLYGSPDDFRRFVDRAHSLGLGVILDMVYNHFGPDGNYLKQFAEAYFTDRYKNEWSEAINFDGDDAGPVREFFVANAGYWIDEFHLDGLRLDATQQIFDRSADHILAAINRRVREAARGRATLLVAENEVQHARLVRPPEKGGYGLDAVWNDDFHHSARVALTGHNEAYYTDFRGDPQEFLSAVKWGYLYQGQWYQWQQKRRGTPALDLAPAQFVTFIQNHDQVANSGRGQRYSQLSSPGRLRAMTALLLLAPGTPMLFQGQEFAASSPFLFFADHNPDLAKLVRKGRGEFLAQFRTLAVPEVQAALPDPADIKTFERCKLDFSERERNHEMYALHRDLLQLRRDDAAFRAQQPRGADGAVLGPQAFVLRFFVEGGDDRLLLVNYGRDLHLDPAPEPLLAPPEGKAWAVLWSSEDLRYGGNGTAALGTDESWRIPGEAAVVLRPGESAGARV